MVAYPLKPCVNTGAIVTLDREAEQGRSGDLKTKGPDFSDPDRLLWRLLGFDCDSRCACLGNNDADSELLRVWNYDLYHYQLGVVMSSTKTATDNEQCIFLIRHARASAYSEMPAGRRPTPASPVTHRPETHSSELRSDHADRQSCRPSGGQVS